MEANSPNPIVTVPAEASNEVAAQQVTDISQTRNPLRWFTGRASSWGLAFIAVGAWSLSCLAKFGMTTFIPIDDLGIKSLLMGSCAFLLLTLIKLPTWQVAGLPGTENERFEAENEARKTLAQIIGGLCLILGLYFTSLQLRETQLTSSNNEAIARDGQITDRYIKAVQQLGTTDEQNLPVRIGAIFSLERIARESKTDYGPIMELLSAYVRDRSGPPLSEKQRNALTGFRETMPFFDFSTLGEALDSKSKRSYVVTRDRVEDDSPTYVSMSWPNLIASEDTQAAMTVIGRRQLEYEDAAWHPIELRFADLRGLDLRGAHLEGADLEGTNLQDADLTGACLCGADLQNSLMDTTKLDQADLRRADLTGAVILNTDDKGADAREAVILWAAAPSHEDVKRGAIGFASGESEGMIIGPWLEKPPGAVVVQTDERIALTSSPFPAARANSHCLERSAPIWLSNGGG